MAVKSKSKKPAGKALQKQQQVKPAKKQRPQAAEEEEDDDSEEEPSFTHPKAGKPVPKVKLEPEVCDDDDEDDDDEDDDDEEVDEEQEAEEEEDDSEEEAPAEKPAKPVKRKAEPVVKQEPVDEDDENKHTVFVSHIYNVTNEVLTAYFAKAGEIEAIRNINKKGYAFVKFANDEAVENALKMDGQEWNGKNIIVQRAKSKKSDAKKRRADNKKAEGEPQAKKSKDGGKVVNLKPNQKGNFKGKPKTPQKPNPNKKQNKPKQGAFVKAK